MKKLITIIGLACCALTAVANKPAVATVGTNSVKLVAAKPLTGVNTWRPSFFYKQGTVVTSVKRYYMAVSNGTSGAVAPTHSSGEVSDGGVTWRWIDKNPRNGVIITINEGQQAYWSFSNYAADTNSIKTVGEVWMYVGDEYQGPVHIISGTSNTITVAIQEL